MLARRALKLSDFGLTGKETLRSLLAKPNCSKERVGPEASANDKPSDPVSNVNKPVDDFDLWWLFKQYRAVEITPHVLRPSRSKTTEQAKGDAASEESKPLTDLTWVNSPRFRRTVESLRRADSVTSELGTPANDNTDPSQAEAA